MHNKDKLHMHRAGQYWSTFTWGICTLLEYHFWGVLTTLLKCIWEGNIVLFTPLHFYP